MSDTATTIVALVEDDEDLRAATTQLLTLAGFAVQGFPDAASALGAIDRDFAGVVVTDVRMPGISGIDLFRALRARDADLPVILVTGHGDVAMAVGALKAGAWDFLTKPFEADVLIAVVTRAASARGMALENRRLRALAEANAGEQLVGDAPSIRRLRAMVPVLAESDLDMVIEGETGTGKELYARLVHRAGRRGRHRFALVDCATVPAAIVERELFARGGIISRAHRGTLFLDNLDAADSDFQHRLTRLAEERAVGLDTRDPDPVDLRVIAAMGDGGRDRIMPALFHRLAGVPLRMPPLAERTADIPLLAAHFIAEVAARHRIAAPEVGEILRRITARDWPGNVRELEKSVERLCLGIEQDQEAVAAGPLLPLTARLDAFERAAILDAITSTGGEIAPAIDLLQIPRKTFYYRVKRLGIDLAAHRLSASKLRANLSQN